MSTAGNVPEELKPNPPQEVTSMKVRFFFAVALVESFKSRKIRHRKDKEVFMLELKQYSQPTIIQLVPTSFCTQTY